MQEHIASGLIPVGVEIADAGTRLAVMLGESPETRRGHKRLAVPPEPDDAVAQIGELVARAVSESGMANALDATHVVLGVAVWGEVDAEGEVVRRLPPVPAWREYPLAQRLAERWGGPVRLLSATSAGALAEQRTGAGTESRQMLYVALGRSVTCAVVSRGRLLVGAHGNEGMLAHTLVAPSGPRCSCGMVGHLEPIASAQSIVRAMIGRASGSDESTAAMLRASGGRAEAMSAAQVARLAAEGEPAAKAVMTAALDALALALSNAIALLDPDVVVVSGPLTVAGDDFFQPLRDRLATLTSSFAPEAPLLVPAALDPVAPLLGARLLAAKMAARADGGGSGGVF